MPSLHILKLSVVAVGTETAESSILSVKGVRRQLMVLTADRHAASCAMIFHCMQDTAVHAALKQSDGAVILAGTSFSIEPAFECYM